LQRLKKQRELGILLPEQKVSEADSEVPRWDNLTYDQKQLWKAKMEVYAAMIDRVDQSIGRVLAKLKELKKDENTLIVFISDNGAQGGYSRSTAKPQRNSDQSVHQDHTIIRSKAGRMSPTHRFVNIKTTCTRVGSALHSSHGFQSKSKEEHL